MNSAALSVQRTNVLMFALALDPATSRRTLRSKRCRLGLALLATPSRSSSSTTLEYCQGVNGHSVFDVDIVRGGYCIGLRSLRGLNNVDMM